MRPNSGKAIKKAGNNIVSKPKPGSQKGKIKPVNNNNVILMRDLLSTPGNGLWCQGKVDEPYQSIIPELTKGEQLLTKDPQWEADKQLIAQLKFQVNDLSTQLQNQMAKCYDAEYRAERAENTKETYINMIEQKSSELKDFEYKATSTESTLVHLNEALANAKREIIRLNNELSNESNKSKSQSKTIEKLMIEKDRMNYQMSSEMNSLMKKFQSMTSEKENLIKRIEEKNKDQNEDYSSNIQKVLENKEAIVKTMELSMTKAINEASELKRKLVSEEQTKMKLNEIIKVKKEKIQRLKEQLKGYREDMSSYGNEVKWNQDKITQKDQQIKILKDKLKQKDDEIEKINIKNKQLSDRITAMNKEKENKVNEDQREELIEVKAKPFLFGPEREWDQMN